MTNRISVRELDATGIPDGQGPVVVDGKFEFGNPTAAGAVALSGDVTTLAADKTINGTALTDVGLSGTLVSAGPTDQFYIHVSLDIDGSSSATLGVPLLIDDEAILARILVRAGASARRPATKTYLVEGLAAGSHTWKLQANLSAASGSYLIWADHSQVVVARASGAAGGIDGGTWDSTYSDFIDGGTF